ncbi:MAG: NAD(P)H-hydrate dehydratase [Chthoniobacterales bacterium]
MPRLITDAVLRRWPLPGVDKGGSKEKRGRALIIAGAVEMPGAAILASTAALRAGCGKVRLAIAEAAAIAVGCAVPELFVLPIATGKGRNAALRNIIDSAHKADAVLMGPGMRDIPAIRFLLPRLLSLDSIRAVIIDATALRVLADLRPRTSDIKCPLILTPHHAEAATLCNSAAEKISEAPLHYARDIAGRFDATIVLKSAETVICAASTNADYLNRRGNIGLATAGSGDVLAGIIAGLCARGADPVQATVWAVALHAQAGEHLGKRVGLVGYLARELVDEIPGLLPQPGK